MTSVEQRFQLALIILICLAPAVCQGQDLLFTNSDFESGDLTNWTEVSGDCWSTSPAPSNGPFIAQNPPQGSWAAWSAVIGTGDESHVGVLESTTFTVPAGQDAIVFNIAGWANQWHRVDVYLAADDSLVASAQMPSTTHIFTEQTITGMSAYEGQDLYLQIVDENNDGNPSSNGWLGVDNFHWFTAFAAEGLTGNGNFELGDFTYWTANGAAFGSGPVLSNGVSGGKEGNYFADTFHSGEPATGSLQSDSFVLGATDEALQFLIAGWNGPSNDRGLNFVVVREDGTDTELSARVTPFGGSNDLQPAEIDLRDHAGKTVYVYMEDGDTDTGYAWMSVDQFRLAQLETYPALGINGNGNFELGDFTAWHTTGAAFGAGPVKSNGVTAGKEGAYFVDTFSQGETAMGTLYSDSFVVDNDLLRFLIGGWPKWPGTEDPISKWVVVRDAGTDEELTERVSPPGGNNDFSEAQIDVSDLMGRSVYVEIVDEDEHTGYAWIVVDNFHLDNFPLTVSPAENSQSTLETGSHLALSVTASGGAGLLSYQWYKNGEPIDGADGPMFSIEAVQESDSGTYWCEVTDENTPPTTVSSGHVALSVVQGLPLSAVPVILLLIVALALVGVLRLRRTHP